MDGAAALGLPPIGAPELVLLGPSPAVPDLNWPCSQLSNS